MSMTTEPECSEAFFQKNRCDWNPVFGRAALTPSVESDCRNLAKVSLGNGKWHLCERCAALPRFKRFTKRTKLGIVFKDCDEHNQ